MERVIERINKAGIIPVATVHASDAVSVCRALVRGGIDIIEVTFRTEDADEAIRKIKTELPDMLVGGGTVLSIEQARAAHDAGADFLVTPGFDAEIVQYCQRKKLPIFPGCVTPTEYQSAYSCGLDIIKFFPAEQSGGVAMIKALTAPYPKIRVIPTGGISLDNLGDYLGCPCVLACGGSYMVAQKLISDKAWDKIEEFCRMTVDKIKEIRHG